MSTAQRISEGSGPVLCPVCLGHGIVARGFFRVPAGQDFSDSDTSPEKCITCDGRGVLWNRPTAPTEVPGGDLPAGAGDTLLSVPEIDRQSGTAKQAVFFIDSSSEGMGNHANSKKSALEWFKGYLENMDNGDTDEIAVERRDMTQAEIDELPEL